MVIDRINTILKYSLSVGCLGEVAFVCQSLIIATLLCDVYDRRREKPQI